MTQPKVSGDKSQFPDSDLRPELSSTEKGPVRSVEFTGKDLEEAIASAAASLNLPPEKVKFNVLTMGSRGLFGLGRRKARISVDPADPALNLDEAQEPERPEKIRPTVKEAARRPADKPAPAEPKAAGPGDESRDNRAGRAKKPQPAPSPRPEKSAPAPGRDKRSADKPAQQPAAPVELRTLDWAHVPPPPTQAGPGESARLDLPDGDAGRLAEEVVRGITGRMGLEVKSEVRRIGSRIIISLDSPDNALLIGNRGSTLEALQLLAAKILLRQLKSSESESGPEDRLVLDVAGYRARRQTQLLENLKNLAEEVRGSGQARTLGGLSPAERRLVTLALRPFKDLAISPGGGRDSLSITAAAASGPRPRRPKRPQPSRRSGDRKSSS